MTLPRVAMVSPYPVSARGGISLYVDGLSRRLRLLGYAVDVLTVESPQRAAATLRRLWAPLGAFRIAKATADALQGLSPDVVHVHGHWFHLFGALFHRRRTGCRVIFTQHTLPTRRYSPVKRLIESVLLSLADTVCVPSQATWDAMRAVAGLWIGAPYRVVGGAPADHDSAPALNVAPQLPTVGFCSLLVHREKLEGALDLLSAFATVLSTVPAARMVMVGGSPDGAAEIAIRTRIRELDIDDHIDFRGSSNAPWTDLQSLSVFVHASRRDSLSLSLLEAMARGLPVVATDIGGTQEAVQHGINGLLVKPGDVCGLAAEISRLLIDKRLAHDLGEHAMATVAARFNWTTVAATHVGIYRALTEATHPD